MHKRRLLNMTIILYILCENIILFLRMNKNSKYVSSNGILFLLVVDNVIFIQYIFYCRTGMTGVSRPRGVKLLGLSDNIREFVDIWYTKIVTSYAMTILTLTSICITIVALSKMYNYQKMIIMKGNRSLKVWER